MTQPLGRHMELVDEAATLELGARLAEQIKPGQTLWLIGQLGAGKTTLVRGLLQALGHQGAVKSPTYTLVEPYTLPSGQPLYHFDLYRMEDPEELEWAGGRDYFTDQAIALIEWPEQGEGFLPTPHWKVELLIKGYQREAIVQGPV